MQRRAFLKMFVAATAAIVADPKALIADTAAAPTALIFHTAPAEVVCSVAIIPAELDARALALMMTQFAQQMCGALGVPEHMVFGRGGAPSEDEYYAHIIEARERWSKQWCEEVSSTIIDKLAPRIIKVMEAAHPYDVQIL